MHQTVWANFTKEIIKKQIQKCKKVMDKEGFKISI
jgi:hypothetical protein